MFIVRSSGVRSIGGLLLLWVLLLRPSPSFGQDQDKLDPVLKRLLMVQTPGQVSVLYPLVKTTGIEPVTDVFIQTDGGSPVFATPGIEVKTVIGDLVVATVPLSRLEALAAEPQVLALYAAKIWTPLLDASVPATKADSVRTLYDVRGKDVVMGVIDTGIDWRHRSFRSLTDTTKTRIKFLWDMSDAAGPPPTGFVTSGGTEYNEAKINQGLAGSATVNEKDEVGHGTHVAGIAAGNGGGSQYVGVAPDADLIIVKATRSDAQSFISTDVVTAMNYIDSKAASLGKPYVINLSLGGQQGPHDGRSAESQAIDNLVGTGKTEKMVVAAAGNEGRQRVHATGTMNANSAIDVSKSFTATAGTEEVTFDIWTQVQPNNPNTVFISVAGPDTTFGPVSGFPTASNDNSNGTITVVSSPFPSAPTGTDINTNVNIVVKKSGTWSIKIRGSRGTGSGRFDMWIYTLNAEFISADGDIALLVGTPGDAQNAITVGAYVTKSTWTDASGGVHTATSGGVPIIIGDESDFSSPGPTRPGPTRPERLKPEISGPGQVIASALSRDATPGGNSIFGSGNILPGNMYAIAQGTSMATPHVAGVVALALHQGVKDTVALDAIQMRAALQTTARSDAFTGTVPNSKWGFGKMDVRALFTQLFGAPRPITAVTLVSFSAQTDGRRVELVWRITDVTAHAGFHVYRSSTSRPADRQRLSPQLLTGGGTLTFYDTPEAPGTYYYWLADVDEGGLTHFHGPLVVTFTSIPSTFSLEQNSPNPFNPATTIAYALPRVEQVVIRIYDALGREVCTLVDARQIAGFHEVVWDGRNHRGVAVSSGVYFYTLVAGDFVRSRKMTLMK